MRRLTLEELLSLLPPKMREQVESQLRKDSSTDSRSQRGRVPTRVMNCEIYGVFAARALNKTEARFFREVLRGLPGIVFAQAIVLPFGDGTSYRPDFVRFEDGQTATMYEVKGGHVGKVAWSRHGIERYRRARDLYGQHIRFELWVYDKKWKRAD